MRAALLLLCTCSSPAPPLAQPTPAPADAAPADADVVRVLPVKLTITPPTLVKADAPTKLMLAEPIAVQVMRSGKDRLVYTVSVCSGPSLIVHEVTRSTGFPDLDHFVDRQLGIFIAPPRSGCATVTLVLDVRRSSFQFTGVTL